MVFSRLHHALSLFTVSAGAEKEADSPGLSISGLTPPVNSLFPFRERRFHTASGQAAHTGSHTPRRVCPAAFAAGEENRRPLD